MDIAFFLSCSLIFGSFFVIISCRRKRGHQNMQYELEMVTIIHQDGERQLTTLKTRAHVTQKNDAFFIRYQEADGTSVYIKWNEEELQLTRRVEPVNKMIFKQGHVVPFSFRTSMGSLEFQLYTHQIEGRVSSEHVLKWLEWRYQLKDEKKIMGEYQVKLHFN